MQNAIHPTWFSETTVTCACGNSFTTGSTQESIQVDICSKCHPFFTGEMRFVDRQGRVDRFQQKMNAAAARKIADQAKKAKKADPKSTEPAQSYQDILKTQQTRLKSQKAATKVA